MRFLRVVGSFTRHRTSRQNDYFAVSMTPGLSLTTGSCAVASVASVAVKGGTRFEVLYIEI